VVAKPFLSLARMERGALGLPGLSLVEVGYPIGTLPDSEIMAAANDRLDILEEALIKVQGADAVTERTALALLGEDDLSLAIDEFYRRGWTDGLPVVPPTTEAVQRMLGKWKGDAPIVTVPPRWGVLTAEKLAANAVMAGCVPEHFDVLVAAFRAMSEPRFNLYGIQATTNPVAPLVIVSGPIVGKLNLNFGNNALGQGAAANATIGRAVRLALVNVGGATPGYGDKATLGQPAKYSFCIAENEAASPWGSFRAERGFDASTSTVTVHGSVCTINCLDMWSKSAEGVLISLSHTLTYVGSNDFYFRGEPLIILSPEHAAILAGGGYDVPKIREWLFRRARIPLADFPFEAREYLLRLRSKWEEDVVAVTDLPEDIMVMVSGGVGPHSMILPSFGDTRSVTVPIESAPALSGD
jgi:hypothetical protein